MNQQFYRDFDIYIPSPVVHIVNDPNHNIHSKLQDTGSMDRPFNATNVNDLRTILDALPSGRHVKLGPGEYQLDFLGYLAAGPSQGFFGVNLRKDIILEGAGIGATIIKAIDGDPGLVAYAEKSLISVSATNGTVDETNVVIASMTLDGNMANAAYDGNPLVHRAISASNKDFHAENLHLRDFGGDSVPLGNENFCVFCVSRNVGQTTRAVLRDILYDQEGSAMPSPSNNYSVVLLGGNVDGSWTHGIVENVRVYKTTMGGVPLGTARTRNEGILFKSCHVDSAGNSAGLIHDTGASDNLRIDDCYFKVGPLAYNIVIGNAQGFDDENTIISNCRFHRAQGQVQHAMLIGDASTGQGFRTKKTIVKGCRVTGTAPIGSQFIGDIQGTTILAHDNLVDTSAATNVFSSVANTANTREHDNYTETMATMPKY